MPDLVDQDDIGREPVEDQGIGRLDIVLYQLADAREIHKDRT